MNPDRKNPEGSDEQQPIILVVDDDTTNLAIMTDSLEECNYRILVAEDGESGVKGCLCTAGFDSAGYHDAGDQRL